MNKMNNSPEYEHAETCQDQKFLKAMKLRDDKQCENARLIFKELADQKHLMSCYIYRTMLKFGQGGPKDNNLAQQYINGKISLIAAEFKTKADQGCKYAQTYYAIIAKSGNGCIVDLNISRHYYKLAAKQGYFRGQFGYANCLDDMKNYNLAIKHGHIRNQSRNTNNLNKNMKKAEKYYKLAADQNFANAQNNYGIFLQYEKGTPADLMEARKYYKLAIKQNHDLAQFNYAIMLQDGLGGPINKFKARKYYKFSADQGYVNAQFGYALMLLSDQGGPIDWFEARRYFKLAADQGHQNALTNYESICKMAKPEQKL